MSSSLTIDNLSRALARNNTKIQPQIDELNNRSIIGSSLPYAFYTMSSNIIPSVGSKVIFDNVNDIIGTDIRHEGGGLYSLKKGHHYRIKCTLNMGNVSGYCYYGLYESIGNTIIGKTGVVVSANYSSTMANTHIDAIYTPASDLNVYIKLDTVVGVNTLYSSFSYLIIEEVGREIIVDPLDYKDSYRHEYGNYSGLTDSQPSVTPSTNIIQLLSKTVGNMEINPDYTITLKQNKKYRIIGSIPVMSAATSILLIDTIGIIYCKSYAGTTNGWSDSIINTIIDTGTTDIKVYLKPDKNSTVYLAGASLTIEEVSTPVVVEYNTTKQVSNPMAVEPLQYSYLTLSVDQITTGMPVGTPVKFNTQVTGNMSVDGTNFGIKLKAGRTYEIHSSVLAASTGNLATYLQLKDLTSNAYIGNSFLLLKANYTTGMSDDNRSIAIYTPPVDCTVALVVKTIVDGSPTTIYKDSSMMMIKEIKNEVINQYGGFEKTILFSGNINANGTYVLSDDVENYDMVVILYKAGVSADAANSRNMHSIYLPVEQVGTKVHVGIASGNSVSYYTMASVQFSLDTMTMVDFSMTGFTYYSLYEVIGIKGTIPTLLSGGVA